MQRHAMLAAVVAMLRVVVRDREAERIVAETVERIDRSKRGYQIAILPGDDPTTDGQRRRGQTVGEYYADQMGEVDMSEPDDVAAELACMQELYCQGAWERS